MSEDQNPNGENPGGTAGNGEDPKPTPPEGFVSKEQYAASQTEAIRLAKELETFKKNPPQNGDLPKEKFKELLSEVEKEKAEQAKKDQEEIRSSLDKLHKIHGDFDDKKLKDTIAEYGVYTEDGDINWEKGIDLYKKLGNSVTKKPEPGARTKDDPLEAEKVEVRGKDMHSLVQEGLKKLGFKG